MNIGDSICDMHYGLPDGAKNHIKFYADNAKEIVEGMFVGKVEDFSPENKIAYLVSVELDGLIFVYQYDCRFFGVFEIPYPD